MSLSRIRITALGALAVATTAMGMAGCGSDDGSTIIGGSSSIPVITGLSHPAVLTNGQTPAGTAVRLEIRGDDFDKNAEVILLAKAPATLSATAANLTSGIAGVTSQQCIRIPASNRQWQSQNRIDILTLPGSPLAAANLQGTVIVQVINPGAVASTDGTPDGSGTADELTYYADTGVQVAVAQAGSLAGAWGTVFPGQSGVEFLATITNMTIEPINSVAISGRSLNFGTQNPHVLNYITEEPTTTTLAVGASTTVRFLAAFSNELPGGALGGTCAVTAVGATSGRSYTGTGSATLNAGATPSINVRGGNNQSDGNNGGVGGSIQISSYDAQAANNTDTNGLGGLTIGAASTVTALADQAPGVANDAPQGTATRANLIAGDVTEAIATNPLVFGGGSGANIELAAGNHTWTFTGAQPVVFKNVTIRFQDTVAPGNLIIRAEHNLQFINCTIDLTDRRTPIPATGRIASGSLLVNGGRGNQDRTVDIQGCTFRTAGVRGGGNNGINGTAAGNITILANVGASDGTDIIITNSTLDARGASMVNAVTLPGSGGTTTAGGNVLIRTQGNTTVAEANGRVSIDRNTVINTSGGDAVGYTTGDGADAGTVVIQSGVTDASPDDLTDGNETVTLANVRDVIMDGQIIARGGDALDGSAGNGATAGTGGVAIVGRKIAIGNAGGAPVLLANGGSSSVVGGQSVAVNPVQGNASTGGGAGAIRIGTNNATNANPMQGPISIAQGAGLIAIGGGGDTGGGQGGLIQVQISRTGNTTPTVRAVAQTVSLSGVIDSSGGWARVQGNGGAGNNQTLSGNTDVTLAQQAVMLALGGSPARSANTATPVSGGIAGGNGGTITVTAGGETGSTTATGGEDLGRLEISGMVSTRGGFYTLGGAAAQNGGDGNTVTLSGEGVRLLSTGKVITNGGSCGDTGAENGGRAGQISVTSSLNANQNGLTGIAAGDTDTQIAGLLQADGGNLDKAGQANSSTGSFSVSSPGGAANATVAFVVNWPKHGAKANDLVSVTTSLASGTVSRVAVTVLDADNFSYSVTYPAAPATNPSNVQVSNVTLFRNVHGVGGSNTILVRQDNQRLDTLDSSNPPRRDSISVTGKIYARAGKVNLPGSNPLTQPGIIRIYGSGDEVNGTAGIDGANITIDQQAEVIAAGDNEPANATAAAQSLILLTEDDGVITVRGKVHVDNDRPASFSSVRGSLFLSVLNTPNGENGRIVVESTGELLMTGGYPAGATNGNSGIFLNNATTGAIAANAAAITITGTIRNEDQTTDATAVLGANDRSGHGGVISITASGQIDHTAGEVTARGTDSRAGHGGTVTFSHTGGTAGEFLNLSGNGIVRVDGGGSNGWGGRIQLIATNAGLNTAHRIRVLGTYTLSANGSGRGGGGLPQNNSLRLNSNGLGEGGIYIANVTLQNVTIGTTTAITATGGNNTAGTRNANGTAAGGCLGGLVVIGDGQDLGNLTINSSIDVSGGANGAGPGGPGGAINVRCGGVTGANGATNIGTGANVTWTADGGASTFPQSLGGVGGNITIAPANVATIVVNIGDNSPNRFAANLRGGAGTTVGGNGGVFDVSALGNNNGDADIDLGATNNLANISVIAGTGSINGTAGVVRLRKQNGGSNFDTVVGANQTLVVEPTSSLVVQQ